MYLHYTLLFLITSVFFTGPIYASEYVMNDQGYIVSIDTVDIDWRKVGVLKYDYKPTKSEISHINNRLQNHISYRNRSLIIIGYKKINDAILITMSEKNVEDGGDDIVFSTVSLRIIGRFFGGIRG